MPAPEVVDYARDLAQEIWLETEVEGAELMRSEVFTRRVIDTLIEAGELEDAIPCHHVAHGIEVHGYGIDDEDTLNLIATVYRGDVPPTSVTRTDARTTFRRLESFWERCRDRTYHEQLEESSDAFDMALHIRQAAEGIRRLKLFLLTDCESKASQLEQTDIGGVDVRRTVWDIVRLQRLETSGQARESIEVNLTDLHGGPLPCLAVGSGHEDYSAFLAVFPGELLGRVYDEYGARLLELNVRSFLQATGKVNRGIRDTINKRPERFLAYNNGISATASSIEVIDLPGGGSAITGIKDLQIVNGGQTTASVHRAFRGKADLSAIAVQAKITVVDPERLGEIVPEISRYANSQNKVSEADLRSNDPFHIELEGLSRTVWAPAVDGAQRQTRWFYERARGQYNDALNREGTPARQRAWKETHPMRQRMTKTDVSKFENTWDQLPHEVSRGAQKNFTLFMTRLANRKVSVDVRYFERLVAKAILFKRTEEIVSSFRLGGYRANVVVLVLAKLSHVTQQRVDLASVWAAQSVPRYLEEELERLVPLAWEVLVDRAPAGSNITEWAKRAACWELMRDAPWSLSAGVQRSLRAAGRQSLSQQSATVVDDDAALQAIRSCVAVGGDGWFALSNWAKETHNLQPWQRALSFSLGKRIKGGQDPTAKQAVQGVKILTDAKRVGYTP